MALLSTLLLLLAATLTASEVRYRRCNCIFRNNRAIMSKQYCQLDQEHEELSYCTDEMVPRISPRYEYIEPQGLFSYYRNHERYHNARVFCEQEGARLAVPQSKDVFKKLFEVAKPFKLKPYPTMGPWLGLNDMETEGTWVDIDGNKPPVLPWPKPEPNNLYDEDCGELHMVTGWPNDNKCWIERPFICERRLRKPIPPGYKWCASDQRFYKFYKDDKTFPEAREVCERDGGALASIDTIDEALCALWMLPGIRSKPFVDFTDEAAEGEFVNSKGQPLESMEFRIWEPDQPDNGGKHGPQNCLILVGTGHYDDVSCQHAHPFLCELIPY